MEIWTTARSKQIHRWAESANHRPNQPPRPALDCQHCSTDGLSPSFPHLRLDRPVHRALLCVRINRRLAFRFSGYVYDPFIDSAESHHLLHCSEILHLVLALSVCTIIGWHSSQPHLRPGSYCFAFARFWLCLVHCDLGYHFHTSSVATGFCDGVVGNVFDLNGRWKKDCGREPGRGRNYCVGLAFIRCAG
jgi:hypothetical protein